MTINITSPPRPRCALRVGIVGHRFHRLPPEGRASLRQELARILALLSSLTKDLQREHAWAFSDCPPEMRLVSCLAAGADSYASQAALDAGYVLEAILPFPEADYARDVAANANPNDPADLEAVQAGTTFARLRSKARASLALEARDLSEPASRDHAYLAAGRLLIEHSDVLLAVWDQVDLPHLVGTSRLVAEARAKGSLVVLLDPRGEKSPRILRRHALGKEIDIQALPLALDAKGATVDLRLELDRLLAPPPLLMKTQIEAGSHALPGQAPGFLHQELHHLKALLMPSSVPAEEPSAPAAGQRLRRFYEECCHDTTWWGAYKALRWLCGCEAALSLPVEVWPGAVARSEEPARFLARLPADLEPLRQGLVRVQERWLVADNISTAISHAYRSAYVLNFTLAALTVVMGLFSLFFWNSIDSKVYFVGAEILLIVVILTLTRLGQRRSWHQRWLDYRQVAELLRMSRMPLLLGHSFQATGSEEAALDDGNRWVVWYVRATLREAGLPSIQLDTTYLGQVIDSVLDEEIGRLDNGARKATGQIKYHQGNVERLNKIDHFLEKNGERSFLFTAIAAGAWLALYTLESFDLNLAFAFTIDCHGHKECIAYFFKPLVTFLTAALPAIGAALAGIRAQGDFKSFAKRSEETLHALVEIERQLTEIRETAILDRVALLFAKAQKAMLSDLGAWRLLYRHRDIDLPA